MLVMQALIAMLLRSAGKIFNTALGWTTITLFGKVPQDRQLLLSTIAFGSLAWVLLLIAMIAPSTAQLLILVPLPEWTEGGPFRVAMLVLVVITPPIMGLLSLFVLGPEDRPEGLVEQAKAVVRGYPACLGLALAILMVMFFSPLLKFRHLLKRWTTEHIPVVIEPDDYQDVLGSIQTALAERGLETRRCVASWTLRYPTKILTLLAGGAAARLVSDNLTGLEADEIEVLVHPSDLVISGPKHVVARAQSILTEHLPFTRAYLTWDKEAHEMEDRLRALWSTSGPHSNGSVSNEALQDLERIQVDLEALQLPYEEWEVLFREKLLVERRLLQSRAQ